MADEQSKVKSSESGADFREATGLDYVQFLAQLHQSKLFDWYFEIGTRHGDSLMHCRSKSISVDPFYKIKTKHLIGVKPELYFFQTTSDVFFEGGFLKRNKIKLSFSFLDGMHLFEYLLRDFINAEAASNAKGVIAMHDCCPANADMEQRDLNAVRGKSWTGDVWKLVPILKKYRPDLTVTVLDCSPTGLVLVNNLDPKNTILRDKYDAIIKEFMDVRLQDFGIAKYNSLFEFTNAEKLVQDGFGLFDDIAIDPSLVLAPEKISP